MALGENILINNGRLTPIDILSIDRQSRLTITKKFKKLIHLNPNDKITVYHDMFNKKILLKVQHHEAGIENWILTKCKDNSNVTSKVKDRSLNIQKNDPNNIVNKSYDNNLNIEKKLQIDSESNKKEEMNRYNMNESNSNFILFLSFW